jgi:hypothetical protein
MMMMMIVMFLLASTLPPSLAWSIDGVATHATRTTTTPKRRCNYSSMLLVSPTHGRPMTRLHDGSGGDGGGGEDSSLSPFGGEPGVVYMPDLAWRVEKLRLEEQNQQRFLKALPRFLPYTECRKWVQAFGRWKTREDWREWISMGEKRNSYIPVRYSLSSPSSILIISSHIIITINRANPTNTTDDSVSGLVGITFSWKTRL